MSTPPTKNTLLVGHPRSGTTWVSHIVGAGRPVVSEPDNEVAHPLGFGFKRAHRFPAPSAFDASGLPEVFRRAAHGDPDDIRRRALQRLLLSLRWNLEPWVARNCGSEFATTVGATRRPALDGDRAPASVLARACRTVMPPTATEQDGRVIKSVHGVLVAEQIQQTIDCNVVAIVRNPFAVLASLRRPIIMAASDTPIENPDRYRALEGLSGPAADRDLHQVVRLVHELLLQADRHADWTVVSHDELCRNPHVEFEKLASSLNIPAAPVMDALAATTGDGAGLSVKRASSLDQIDSWKQSLDAHTVSQLSELIEGDLARRLGELCATGAR